MRRAINKLQKTIFGIYGATMIAILALMLCFDKWVDYLCQGTSLVPNFVLLAIAIGILALYFRYENTIALGKSSVGKSLLIFAVLLLVIQVFIAYNIYFLTGWDASIVNYASSALHSGSEFDVLYFQTYPNNIFLLYVLTLLKSISGSYLFVMLVGIVLVNVSVLVTGLCIYELTDSKKLSYIGFWLGAMVFGLSPWIVIPYSDVFAILFPVLTVYIYLRSKKTSWSPFVKTLLIAGVPMIGYLIKPQCILVLIAIVICEALQMKQRRPSLVHLAKSAAALILVVSLVWVLPMAARSFTGIPKNEDVEVGSSHFLMLGLNSERSGIYSIEDLAFTESFSGKEAKKEKNLEESSRRIKKMGILGMLKHLSKKTLVNFNDGTFGWGTEGNFYEQVFPEKLPGISSALRSIYYNEGRAYPVFATFQQLLWILVLLLCAAAAWWRGKVPVIHIGLLGIIFFSTIFEARSRYLFAYAPMFVIGAALGLEYLDRRFFNKSK